MNKNINRNTNTSRMPVKIRQQKFAPRNLNNQRRNNKSFNNLRPVQPRFNNVQTKKSTVMLNKIEAIFDYISQGILIVGCVLGGPVMLFGFIQLAIGANDGIIKVVLGLFGIVGGLVTPWVIDWLFSLARNSNMF